MTIDIKSLTPFNIYDPNKDEPEFYKNVLIVLQKWKMNRISFVYTLFLIKIWIV